VRTRASAKCALMRCVRAAAVRGARREWRCGAMLGDACCVAGIYSRCYYYVDGCPLFVTSVTLFVRFLFTRHVLIPCLMSARQRRKSAVAGAKRHNTLSQTFTLSAPRACRSICVTARLRGGFARCCRAMKRCCRVLPRDERRRCAGASAPARERRGPFWRG